MKINPPISSTPGHQIPVQNRKALTKNAEIIAPEEKIRNSSIPASKNIKNQALSLDDKATIAKDFYEYEEKPWTKQHAAKNEQYQRLFRRDMTKQELIENQQVWSALYLGHIESRHSRFQRDLMYTNPDLAQKYYSFTLGDDGELKVLDPGKNLTIAENEWLTEALNKADTLKMWVHVHAKHLMTLVDHDTRTFGRRYELNLNNFQDVIDYRRIIGKNYSIQETLNEQAADIINFATRRNGSFETTA